MPGDSARGRPATRPAQPVLHLDGVSRSVGARVLLAPLSLRLSAGAVCLVTGANGAGKTTLLRVAAGLSRPTTGTRLCAGQALYLRPGAGARRGETVAGAVRGAAALGRVRAPDEAVPSSLSATGLEAVAECSVAVLSAGERSRLALALALAVSPPLLCLDEPTEHLDAAGRSAAGAVLRALTERGCALLVASHDPRVVPGGPDATLRLAAGVADEVPTSSRRGT